MANENTQTKDSMTFGEGLDPKDEILGKEITVLEVGVTKPGQLGGSFAVAKIKHEGKEMQVAFGTVLAKQWFEWTQKMGDKAVPAAAVIVRNRGKRYYSFAQIRKE